VAVVGRKGQQVPPDIVDAASTTLLHRGPDDKGLYFNHDVAFGFRRLSIIDTSKAGHQPMSSDDGRFTVVFNGEIYNYIELRAELAALGHRFQSACDTEVLLASYRQWGADCVHRFNGMCFSFMTQDKDRLRFARPARVKPFTCGKTLTGLFGFRAAAISATGLACLQPDWARFAESVVWNLMDHDNGTCFSDIRQVAAGSRFVISADGHFKAETFWAPPAHINEVQSEQHWIDTLRAVVSDAVRLRQRSDVPIGFTLSGGKDSTLLICEASRLNQGQAGLLAFAYRDAPMTENRSTTPKTHGRDTDPASTSATSICAHPAADLEVMVGVHRCRIANYALFNQRKHGVKVVIGGQNQANRLLGIRAEKTTGSRC
jgi:asparagine synthase (glutamine-hydrolysing)